MTAIREATSADAAAIVALGEAVVPATYSRIDEAFAAAQLERWWSEAAVVDALGRLPHWVAVADDRVVGVANLGTHDGEPVMWKLYVHPDRHGTGVGSRLLEAVEAVADGPALTLEYVGGNDRAARFYEARGFVETRRTPFDGYPDIDWVWMRKELA